MISRTWRLSESREHDPARRVYTNDQFVTYRVNNLVSNLITENINQIPTKQRVRYAAFDRLLRGASRLP